jgi:hypothetical protein
MAFHQAAHFAIYSGTDVDKVALWAGLIASIVGIVLSVVAIVFAVLGSLRLEKVTDATIRSLQKIESDVANVHEQTSGLLKAGWEKMLISVGSGQGENSGTARIDVKALAEGFASEMRSALEELKKQETVQEPQVSHAVKELEEAIDNAQATLETQVSSPSSDRRKPSELDRRLAALPAEARELAFQLRSRHLNADQYKTLRSGPLSKAVNSLRRAGIILPRSGYSTDLKEERVYWFPSDELLTTVVLSRPDDEDLARIVRAELDRVDYL